MRFKSNRSVDLVRTISRAYLSLFILGHMNSVFIYARSFLGIPTDWNFALRAPSGLIHDAWNIRSCRTTRSASIDATRITFG